MQMDIKFPVLARVKKRRSASENWMLVSHSHRVEVPEVSSAETEIALPPLQKVISGVPFSLPELRFHGGRLFRYLQSAHVTGRESLFSSAFATAGYKSFDFYSAAAANQILRNIDGAPLARPIHRLYEERLCAMSMDVSDTRNRTWPKVSPTIGYDQSQNLSLDEALSSVTQVNDDDLDEAFAMHRAQAGRLLLIDDGIWMETKPPCIEVDTGWDERTASASSVRMRYRYLPDAPYPAITSLFFPLSELDRATDMAHRTQKKFRMKDVEHVPHPFELSDHASFAFDTAEDIVHRTGQMLLTNLLKVMVANLYVVRDRDMAWLARMKDIFEADNPVLGRKADYSDDLSEIVDHFLEITWSRFSGGLSVVDIQQIRKALPLVVELMDELPISAPAVLGHQSFSM
jgi:hypothetical protein